MDCDDIQRRLATEPEATGPEVAAHLASCEACAAMVAAARRLPAASRPAAGPGPSWATLAAALEDDDRPLGRPRSWSSRRRQIVGLAIAFALPVLVLAATPRPDLGVYPRARWLLECLALVVVIAWASMIVLRPMHRPITAAGHGVAFAGVLVVVALAALPAAHADHVASLAGDGADLLARAAGCFAFGTLCAVPTWIGLRLLARDGDRPGGRAGIIAAASATVGIAGVYLHCPIVHHAHLWLGHVTVLLLPWLWAVVVARRPGARS